MDAGELDRRLEEALAAIRAAGDAEALRAVERSALDKGGWVAELLGRIPALPPAERPDFGRAVNVAKGRLAERVNARGEGGARWPRGRSRSLR